MIIYLRLPFEFDAACMRAEVENLAAPWKAHFNQGAYEGCWSGLSLRAPGGVAGNLLAENLDGKQDFKDTPLMDQCPYIRQVLGTFKCGQTSVRLLKLERGAVVHEHRDAGLNFEEGEARIHIPVCTHALVDFYQDGDRLDMRAGECWYINASLPHRLANPSPVHRIHLVIDCVVNDWLQRWFTHKELPLKKVKDISGPERLRQEQVITELRRSVNPASQHMADELERKVGQSAGRSEAHLAAGDLLSCIVSFYTLERH